MKPKHRTSLASVLTAVVIGVIISAMTIMTAVTTQLLPQQANAQGKS